MSCHFQNTRRTSGRPGMARSAGTAGSAMSRSRCSCIRRINSSLGSVELACSMVSDDGRYQPTFRSNWSRRLVAGSRLASGGGGGGGSAMAGSSMAAAAIRSIVAVMKARIPDARPRSVRAITRPFRRSPLQCVSDKLFEHLDRALPELPRPARARLPRTGLRLCGQGRIGP